MQWLVCHILRDDYTFADLTTRILRLTRVQIQTFLIEYVAEFRVWTQYEQNVSRIPWHDLVRYAAERRQSVAELLHLYRPSLPTDAISREGLARAARFLHARGLATYAAGLDAWFGIGRMDFLDLNVYGALIRDSLDRDAISKAAAWGWIDMDDVVRRARQRARRLVVETDAVCRQHVFLGTLKSVTATADMQEQVQVQVQVQGAHVNYSRDGVHITPRCNRTVWSGILQHVDEAASVSLMHQQGKRPDARVHAASEAQMGEIRLSLFRQMPALLPHHVPGSLVATAEERARARAVERTAERVAEKSKAASTSKAPRWKATNSLHKAATSRAGDGVSSTSQGARRRSQASSRAEDARSRHQDVSVSVSESVSGARDGSEDGMGKANGDGNRNEPVKATTTRRPRSTPEPSTVEHHATAEPPAAQACSAELRKVLDSTFSNYLRADNRSSSTPLKRKKSMSLLDVVEAQDDDDTDYIPAKASATKRRLAAQPENNRASKPKKEQQPLQKGVSRRVCRQDDAEPSRAVASGTRITTPELAVAEKGVAKKPRVVDDNKLDHVPLGRRQEENAGAAAATATVTVDHGGHGQPLAPEPVKTKKNTDPIFGIPRNQELCGPLERAEEVEYAWSADMADFAMVCGRAKYALKADRIHGCGKDGHQGADTDTDEAHVREAMDTLLKLQTRFGVVEATQRSCAAQDAKRARLAGCADWAVYAAEAEEAEVSSCSLILFLGFSLYSFLFSRRMSCRVLKRCSTDRQTVGVRVERPCPSDVGPAGRPAASASLARQQSRPRPQCPNAAVESDQTSSAPPQPPPPPPPPPFLAMSSKTRDRIYLPIIGIQLMGMLRTSTPHAPR
ncbi:hypothetical protein E4U53_000555 [Claviceps sorghi]|nr:hypothetical protein E4U53_000555 [Claviceps sorghi]